MKKTKQSPFKKDQVVTIDYGNSIAVYLFRNFTKREIVAFWSKRGLGEATQRVEFGEPHETEPGVFLVYAYRKDE